MFVLIVAVVGGLRAYVQNMVLKYNSALTLAAANILIQALTIVISIFLFHTQTSFMMNLGIFISLVGYGAYSYQSGQSKAAAAAKALAAEAQLQPAEGDDQSAGAYPVFTAHSENTGLLAGSNGPPKSVPVSLL